LHNLKISLLISSLVNLLFILSLFLLFDYFEISILKIDKIKLFGLVFIFFTGSFIIIHLIIRHFLLTLLKGFIRRDYSTQTEESNSKQDLDSLTKNLLRFASDKNIEIELLKNQENYRKDFIGNISHELKTPLFTIQSYILTLIDGGYKDIEILKNYLKRTSKGVDRLIYLVKDLDLITEFESGIKNIEPESFNIIKIIDNIFELLEIDSGKNNISLVYDREYLQPINVLADKDRIQQLITNLVVNSIKYGVKNGTTEISIQDLNDEKIIIRVTDNGEGIAKEHLPRLFERFFRIDKSGSRRKGGSGLGLAIVKHIIEAHQEKIYVESTLDIGSEFSFTLQKS
tara:strand:- start:42049 stop:43077 length:1029 start_codon:yes stop_codon:yes gene_type:complete